ncbi:MAG: glycosyltransferase family 4 protein [Chloroflexaceae bacterium]|nr:glycosyltransferase family 4 protein [Chloroflexaceae bacterium]
MQSDESRPLRVLMLSWEYPPYLIGGLGKHVADLVPALAHEGVDVTVMTPLLGDGQEHELIAPFVRIVRVPPLPAPGDGFLANAPGPAFVAEQNIRFVHTALQFVEQTGPFDLIHTHDWLTTLSGMTLKQYWHIPLIATIHATERGRGRGMIHGEHGHQIEHQEWQLSYEAWRIIVCSAFMQQQIQDYFQVPADKIDIIPNGVYLPENPFDNVAERQAFRRRFVADDEFMAFFIGRVVYEKGLHVLIDALPDVLQQVPVRVVIAGRGPSIDDLKRQAEALGISERVHFAGFISDEDRTRLYHTADAAVFPSLYEPFGIVALEASAAGCPVIVARTGGLREVIRSHETGLTVEPGDTHDLARALIMTFQNQDWARALTINAINDIQTRYNWPEIARQTMMTYKTVFRAWMMSDWRFEGTWTQASASSKRSLLSLVS